MGVDVELLWIEQAGTSPRRRQTAQLAVFGDTRFQFAEAVERAQHKGATSVVERIDLYGTLELTWDEMPQFLSELGQLIVVATIDQEREVLKAVCPLSERCGADRNLALRLVGD